MIFIFLISMIRVSAQSSQTSERWEKYRAEKVAFLSEKLSLTSQEAQKFWPIYNELENKRWEAQKSRRELEIKVRDAEEGLPNHEVVKLTRDFAGSLEKEGNLLVKYNEEFLKILPAEKVLKLYQSENEFRMHMIKKFRDRDSHDEK